MGCGVVLELGGVELNPNMQWVDRAASQSVAQTTVRTLGGGLVVYSQGLSQGEAITLEATNDQGWLTKAQADAILALARVPGAVYSLQLDTESFDVVFRHDEPPAVTLRPLIHRLNMESTDYLIGTIKLTTV